MINSIKRWYWRKKFERYMVNLQGDLGVAVRKFWSKIIECCPNIAIPQCGPYEDNDRFQFVWDWHSEDLRILPKLPKHHLDIDVYLNGKFDWFYRDRDSDLNEGSEDQLDAGELQGVLARYFWHRRVDKESVS